MTKLTYFDLAGKAEATRIMFDIAKIKWEDERLSHTDFSSIKDCLPNGQVPVLEVNGEVYCQSGAIFRYASKLAKLYPEDPLEALRVDMLSDQIDI